MNDQLLYIYRKRLFAAIERALKLDDHHKSGEGEIKVTVYYANYFEDVEGDLPEYEMSVYCYVLGPSRNYCYRGRTLNECVILAERDLIEWENELISREARTA